MLSQLDEYRAILLHRHEGSLSASFVASFEHGLEVFGVIVFVLQRDSVASINKSTSTLLDT